MLADQEEGQDEGFLAKFVHVLVTSHFHLKMVNRRAQPLKEPRESQMAAMGWEVLPNLTAERVFDGIIDSPFPIQQLDSLLSLQEGLIASRERDFC